MAMIVSRVIAPASKLATAKALDPATAASSLGVEFGLGEVDESELYAALDWLHERQGAIETALAKRHLKGGTLVLYDVSSSYVEGRCCPLAKRGYNRDGKKGKAQIVYGLLCAADGCPIAIEVFDGNTGDPTTVADQVAKLKQRFALDHVVLVGDRGMITQARIDEDLRPAGLDWITALRAPALQGLVERRGPADVVVRRARHGGDHLARLSRRTIDCLPQRRSGARARPQARGPHASHRARPGQDRRRRRAQDRPLRGAAEIGVAVGAVLDKHKMAKHFELTISDAHFAYRSQDRPDRRGSRARRSLRRAHQPAQRDPRRRRRRCAPTNRSARWSAPFVV